MFNESIGKTKEEAINTVYQHFIVEGNPRCIGKNHTTGLDICRYSNNKGNRCALGILIPLELCERLEGNGGISDIRNEDPFSDLFPEIEQYVDLQLAEDLQDWHDDEDKFGNIELLRNIAKLNNAKVSF